MPTIEVSEAEYCEIQYKREEAKKKGQYWLTPEGRKEIRDTWSNPEDGNCVLPLLNEVERLERELNKYSMMRSYKD